MELYGVICCYIICVVFILEGFGFCDKEDFVCWLCLPSIKRDLTGCAYQVVSRDIAWFLRWSVFSSVLHTQLLVFGGKGESQEEETEMSVGALSRHQPSS
jgi:hypothetical protein